MKDIIYILMTRDGMTQSEAIDFYNSVMESIMECISIGDIYEAEEIFKTEFGLETDYLLKIMT